MRAALALALAAFLVAVAVRDFPAAPAVFFAAGLRAAGYFAADAPLAVFFAAGFFAADSLLSVFFVVAITLHHRPSDGRDHARPAK